MFSYYHGHAYLIVFVSGHVIVATERQARGAQHPFVVMHLAAYWLALLTAVRVTRLNAESEFFRHAHFAPACTCPHVTTRRLRCVNL